MTDSFHPKLESVRLVLIEKTTAGIVKKGLSSPALSLIQERETANG